MKRNVVLAGVGILMTLGGWACAGTRAIDYPEGYRQWSHIKSMVIEPGHPVGIDLESLARPLRPDLLAASMSPAEQAQWQAAPADHQAEWLLRLWCAKEAAAKLLGTGLQGAPERFVVQLAGVGAATARVQCDGWSVGVVLARDGAHVIAVADRLERGAEVAQ